MMSPTVKLTVALYGHAVEHDLEFAGVLDVGDVGIAADVVRVALIEPVVGVVDRQVGGVHLRV